MKENQRKMLKQMRRTIRKIKVTAGVNHPRRTTLKTTNLQRDVAMDVEVDVEVDA